MSGHGLARIEALALIAIGGFAGANLRWLIDTLQPGLGGTLLVNAVGSFLLGFVLYEALYAGMLAEETRFVLSTGFLSSFTTYSTFALETVQAPGLTLLAGNVVATYALGFTGVALGRWIARRMEDVRR